MGSTFLLLRLPVPFPVHVQGNCYALFVMLLLLLLSLPLLLSLLRDFRLEREPANQPSERPESPQVLVVVVERLE